jgi:transposase
MMSEEQLRKKIRREIFNREICQPEFAAEIGVHPAVLSVFLSGLRNPSKRLNKPYLLKESFGQLWEYRNPLWAWRFFRQWRNALRWQRLEPFERFAWMVSAHWDGIAAYCPEENKVPLGFVEGLNNKIRAIQRRADGFRDEDYLRLKILTCMLPKL